MKCRSLIFLASGMGSEFGSLVIPHGRATEREIESDSLCDLETERESGTGTRRPLPQAAGGLGLG